MTITDIDFAGQIAERQLEIPGMDGYVAEKLSLSFSGGVDFTDTTQAEDVALVKSFSLGQEVRLTVVATVTRKGFTLTPSKDEANGDKAGFGVGFKIHSLELE